MHSGLIHQHSSGTYCVLGTVHETALESPGTCAAGEADGGTGHPASVVVRLSSAQGRGTGNAAASQEPLGGGVGAGSEESYAEGRGHSWQKGGG